MRAALCPAAAARVAQFLHSQLDALRGEPKHRTRQIPGVAAFKHTLGVKREESPRQSLGLPVCKRKP